jgi:hypothetical protein
MAISLTSLLPRAAEAHTAATTDVTTFDQQRLEQIAFRIVEVRSFKRILPEVLADQALSDAAKRDHKDYDALAKDIAKEMERRINGGAIKLIEPRARKDGTSYSVRSDFLANYIKLMDELA